jgi:hypothetical protein
MEIQNKNASDKISIKHYELEKPVIFNVERMLRDGLQKLMAKYWRNENETGWETPYPLVIS